MRVDFSTAEAFVRCNDSHFYTDENELFWESRNSIRVTVMRLDLDQVLKIFFFLRITKIFLETTKCSVSRMVLARSTLDCFIKFIKIALS